MGVIHKISPDNGTTEYLIRDNSVAPIELTTTASQAYSKGDQFYLDDGKLYKATASIAQGGTITVGTNCSEADSITEQINDNKTYTDASQSGALSDIKSTVGWDGKNELQIPSSVVSTGIYTVNRNSDGEVTSVVANGTPTAQQNFQLVTNITLDKPKILSGCPSGGSTNDYFIYAKDANNVYYYDYGEGVILPAGTYSIIQITTRANVPMSNKEFKPMLRDASITDSTFEPYHKSVEDWYWENNPNAGVKNFIGSPTSVGSIFTRNANGSYTANGQPSSKAVVRYDFPTENGKKYKVSGCPDGGSSSTYKMDIWNVGSYYDSTPVEITGDGNTQTIEFAIAANYSANNIVFYPMIVDAQDTSSGFQPPAMTNKELTAKTQAITQEIAFIGLPSAYKAALNELSTTVKLSRVMSMTYLIFAYTFSYNTPAKFIVAAIGSHDAATTFKTILASSDNDITLSKTVSGYTVEITAARTTNTYMNLVVWALPVSGDGHDYLP